jgi:nickel-dependent lactate racemase
MTEGNPIWEEMRDIALRPGPSFLVNVALNEQRQITGIFAGDLLAAHKVGIEFVRESAMQKLPAPFDVVVTTASGYPLDQNLYQGVKGIAAAARIVKPGGTIILAAECSDGLPTDSHYEKLLRRVESPAALLDLLAQPGFRATDQWSAQIQAVIQQRAELLLHSALPDELVLAAHMKPCRDIAAAISQKLNGTGRIAVLPQGPLTIPYLAA